MNDHPSTGAQPVEHPAVLDVARPEPDVGASGAAWRGALAGALGAAASLVTIELVAVASATRASVLESVGDWFIDEFAASLKEQAIALFGRNDKAALQIGTAIIAIGLGALLGRRARTHPGWVIGGFAAFGALGLWAASANPLASFASALVACVAAVLVGVGVTFGLERHWNGPARPQVGAAEPDDPDASAAGPVPRRTVLVNAGILGGLLLFGAAAARSARSSLRDAADTVKRAIPAPKQRTAMPSGTFDRGPDAVEGISPYVTPTADFYRIDTALSAPVVDASSWRLKVTGMVDRELELTYDDLLDRDLVEVPITLQCVSNQVGGDLVGTARWTGIRLDDLLREAGVQDGAEQVMGESVDGFTAGFPVKVALDGRDALLAVAMNGHPLPREHGYPARLVVPGLYGYVSATKWIREIRLTTWDEQGYWIPRGWSRLGPIKTQSRIDVPRPGQELATGRQPVAGVAWAPTRGIERVEVRVDGGPWHRAELGPVASDDTWVQWTWAWDARPGQHQVEVRAVDGDGRVQTARSAPPEPDGATGHHTVFVTVGS